MSANVAWEARKLNELGYVGRGKSRHRPRNDPSLYGGSYPFFQTGDIKEAEFHLRSYQQTYNETGLAQSRLWQPGTLCITIAANIAETAILAVEGCFPDSVVGFIPDPAKADVRYVKYYIDHIKVKMQSISRGTTQDNLSVDKLLTFDIPTPSLPTQRKIADILSAYDDLIENNTRRIKILEEMAQMIYREWFVHFRFPGHEQVAMVETELGWIPEGWGAKAFGEVCRNFDSKRIPLSSMQRAKRQGGYPYYGAAKILDYIDDYIFDGRYLLIAEDGSVITTDGKPVLQIATGKFWVNNHAHVIQGSGDVSTDFLYFTLSQVQVAGYITGAAQPKITQANLNRIPVLTAPQALLARFDSLIAPMMGLIDVLEMQTANLRHTRDLLLPKLVSGEVKVDQERLL